MSDKIRKRARANKPSYTSYLRKVLASRHEGIGFNSDALGLLDSLIDNLEERVNVEAVRYATLQKKKTLDGTHIATATSNKLSGKLAGAATMAGTKACQAFAANK
jgi:histone H3/H4